MGWDWLLTQIKESGAKKVGFEGQAMTVATYNSLMKAIGEDTDLSGIEFVPFSDLTDDQRSFKDSDELVMLQKAIDASDRAMELVCPHHRRGHDRAGSGLADGDGDARRRAPTASASIPSSPPAPTAPWPTICPRTR